MEEVEVLLNMVKLSHDHNVVVFEFVQYIFDWGFSIMLEMLKIRRVIGIFYIIGIEQS